MAKDKPKRLTVSLSQQTKEELDTIKHTGQSYDGVTQELIKLWRREKGIEGDMEARYQELLKLEKREKGIEEGVEGR